MSLNYCEYLKIQEIEQMPKRFQKEYFRFLQGLGMVSAEQIAKTTDAPVDAILRLIRELNMRLESQSDHSSARFATLCKRTESASGDYQVRTSFKDIFNGLKDVNFLDRHEFGQIVVAIVCETVKKMKKEEEAAKMANKSTSEHTKKPRVNKTVTATAIAKPKFIPLLSQKCPKDVAKLHREDRPMITELADFSPIGVAELHKMFEDDFDGVVRHFIRIRDFFGVPFSAIANTLYVSEFKRLKLPFDLSRIYEKAWKMDHPGEPRPNRHGHKLFASEENLQAFYIWCGYVPDEKLLPEDSKESTAVTDSVEVPHSSDTDITAEQPAISSISDDSPESSTKEPAEYQNEEEAESADDSLTPVPAPALSGAELTLLPVEKSEGGNETKFGPIDTFYKLHVEIPYSGYKRIQEIIDEYRAAGAIHILQNSNYDLDVGSLEA